MEKMLYVEPTLTKVVLTTNERIANEACEGTGSLPPVPIYPDGCSAVEGPYEIPAAPDDPS